MLTLPLKRHADLILEYGGSLGILQLRQHLRTLYKRRFLVSFKKKNTGVISTMDHIRTNNRGEVHAVVSSEAYYVLLPWDCITKDVGQQYHHVKTAKSPRLESLPGLFYLVLLFSLKAPLPIWWSISKGKICSYLFLASKLLYGHTSITLFNTSQIVRQGQVGD